MSMQFWNCYHASACVPANCRAARALSMDWHAPTRALSMDWHTPTRALSMDWHAPTRALSMDWHEPTRALSMDWHAPTCASYRRFAVELGDSDDGDGDDD